MKNHHNVLNLVLFFSIIGSLIIPGSTLELASKRAQPALLASPTPTITPTLAPAGLIAGLAPDLKPDAISPVAPLVIQFNQSMDPTSAQPALLTLPYTPGEITWNRTYTELTFVPRENFTPDTNYLVFLDQDLQSSSGERFAQFQQWQIHTRMPPRVTGRRPAGPALDVRKPDIIQLTFDQPMDAESVASAFHIQPDIPFELSWAGEKILHIKLLEPLAFGARYRFTLAGTAHDAEGVPVLGDYIWEYWVGDFHVQLSPENDKITNRLTLELSQPIDVEKTGLPFAITPAVNGQWKWTDDDTARFEATQPFSTGIWYSLHFNDTLTDAYNSAITVTEPISFHASPPIRWTAPKTDGYGDCESIQIAFSRPMDHTSIAAALQISPMLEGSFAWSQNTLVFTPTTWIDGYHQPYVVTLQPNALDAQGQPVLVEPYTWSFTCSWRRYPTFSLGTESGADIQVLDAEGRRAMQFTGGWDSQEGISATLRLYKLSLDEFVQRYSSTDWFSNPPTTPLKTWQSSATGGDIHEFFIPQSVPPGLYILRLSEDKRQDPIRHEDAYLLLVITYNTLIVKHGVGQLTAWISDVNGGPANTLAEIRVYDQQGEQMARGRTNGEGYFQLPLSGGQRPALIIARTEGDEGEDITVAGTSRIWEDEGYYCWYCWDDSEDWLPPLTQLKIYAYTDRPIYRPGQTVYFKAILRKDDDARYSLLPAKTPVTVRLRDVRDNVVQTLETQTNAFGSISGEFTLEEGIGTGEYSLEFNAQGENHRQVFKVQEYRKPDFYVELSANSQNFVDGDPMQVSIDTRYFYGQPVANASLDIRIYRVENYYSWWWDGESQDSDGNERYNWSAYPSYSTKAITDASGHSTITLQAKMPDDDNFYWHWWGDSLKKSTFAIEVTANDGSNQEVSSYVIVHVFNAAEKISLDRGEYYKKAGEAFSVTANVRTLENEPVIGRKLGLALEIFNREDWHYYPVTSTFLTTGVSGTASLSLTLKAEGYYDLILTGKDNSGHSMEYTRGIYVIGQDTQSRTSWSRRYNYDTEYDDSDYITISAQQDEYKPYQTARFLIESTFSGPALLTFERSQVYRSIKIKLTAPLTIVEVPILESDAPNVFVTINAWQPMSTSLESFKEKYPEQYWFYNLPDSRLRTASVEIQVDASAKALQVSLSADQQAYAPGQQATFTIQVTDFQGKLVAAEVSLALVDESIFSLSSDLSLPIFSAFYGRREHDVHTFDSMAPYREIILPDRGGGGDEGAYQTANLRSEFEDTAVWIPILETGEDGMVTATVKLPDNLTSWRLTARAITQNTRVGEGQLNILTQREVVVQPFLPHSLVVSDTVVLAAMVHNYGAADFFTVTLAADLLDIITPTQVLSVAAGEGRRVDWLATARQPGEALIIMQAVARHKPAGDAIQLPLTIHPLAIPYIYNQMGSLQDQFTTNLVLPDNALPASGVQVQLSRSIGNSLLDGLEFLTGYPYGCVEQTMSRALPNAVVGRVLAKLAGEEASLQYDLPRMVNAGLANLYSMQHLDGGWGWWHDDETNDYQTAWVVFGLATTAEAGYPVEAHVINNGAKWLTEHLDEMDIRTRTYALYSLAVAGRGEREATLAAAMHLADSAYQLDAFSQAALALALYELGEMESAQVLLDDLAASAVHSNGTIYWPTGKEDGEYHSKTMSSDIRSTALALEAFVRIRPEDRRIPDIVRYLMNRRQLEGWGSTNETAFTLLALTDYLYITNVAAGPTAFRIEMNGHELAAGTLATDTPDLDLTIPISQMVAGINPFTITVDGNSPLYYALTSHILMPQPAIRNAGSLSVTRTYEDSKSGRPLQSFAEGQLVRVILKIEASEPGAYIMLEDYLPGGLEALNTNLNITSHEALVNEEGNRYERFYWQDYGYNNKEIHGNRVLFFITRLETGKTIITYLARAVQAGTFIALPTELTAMYDETVWARSSSAVVTVTYLAAPPTSPEPTPASPPSKDGGNKDEQQ